MNKQWKPGDVAMVVNFVREDKVARFTGRHDDAVGEEHWSFSDGSHLLPHEVTIARPLVVIDPEDREQVERLADALIHVMCKADPDWDKARAYEVRSHMRAALREFANPTPPIEEPTATYAVVRDTSGHEWCHIGGQVWRSLTSTGQFMVEKHWHDNDSPLEGNVDAILSLGYTEDGAS